MNSQELDARASDLHRRSVVIDGHSDILIPIAEGKMRLEDRVKVPDPDTWQAPPGVADSALVRYGFKAHTAYYGPMGQYDLPRFIEGGITVQVCAIYLDDDKLGWPLRRGLEMAWHLHRAVDTCPELELVTSMADVWRVQKQNKVGLLLSFEGFEALGAEPRFLDLYYKLGLRMASLTHSRRNLFADGCNAADRQGGLTAMGKDLIRRMNELGIVIDLVHIGEVGYWEILDITQDPVVLSHSTPTMFPNTDPQSGALLGGKLSRPRLELPRDRAMLEALARNGGVLGIIWIGQADLDDVIRDIETALEVMGPNHVGLGSDLYGLELAPKGLEDISKAPAITRGLLERGHSEEVVTKILGANYVRVFEQVWG
jgi:membrane dipeptidase